MSLRQRDDPARDRTGLADDLGDPTELISVHLAEMVRAALADITSDGRFAASDFCSTGEQDGHYVTDPGMKRVGTVEVSPEGALHLPRAERGVDVHLKFGEADIRVRAVNVATGAAQQRRLGFDGVR